MMRRRLLSSVALALPMALAAQQSTPAPRQPPANPITLSFQASGAPERCGGDDKARQPN